MSAGVGTSLGKVEEKDVNGQYILLNPDRKSVIRLENILVIEYKVFPSGGVLK